MVEVDCKKCKHHVEIKKATFDDLAACIECYNSDFEKPEEENLYDYDRKENEK